MGWNPFKKSSWKKVGKDINKAVVQPVAKAVTSTVNLVAKETTKAVNVAGKTIVDETGKITKEAENLAKDTVGVIQKEVVSETVKAYADTTKAELQTAKVADAAINAIEAGATGYKDYLSKYAASSKGIERLEAAQQFKGKVLSTTPDPSRVNDYLISQPKFLNAIRAAEKETKQ